MLLHVFGFHGPAGNLFDTLYAVHTVIEFVKHPASAVFLVSAADYQFMVDCVRASMHHGQDSCSKRHRRNGGGLYVTLSALR